MDALINSAFDCFCKPHSSISGSIEQRQGDKSVSIARCKDLASCDHLVRNFSPTCGQSFKMNLSLERTEIPSLFSSDKTYMIKTSFPIDSCRVPSPERDFAHKILECMKVHRGDLPPFPVLQDCLEQH
jgi:hypothetical protein